MSQMMRFRELGLAAAGRATRLCAAESRDAEEGEAMHRQTIGPMFDARAREWRPPPSTPQQRLVRLRPLHLQGTARTPRRLRRGAA